MALKKVLAVHLSNMGDAKVLMKNLSADMAAIFQVRADEYSLDPVKTVI